MTSLLWQVSKKKSLFYLDFKSMMVGQETGAVVLVTVGHHAVK